MKKKTRDNEATARVLASLGEGRKTTTELRALAIVKDRSLTGILCRLREAGKIAQDAKGAPWRLTGPAVSPLKEEDEPATTEEIREAFEPFRKIGKKPKRKQASPLRSHPVLGPLYEQRDRLDRAIAILEGRE